MKNGSLDYSKHSLKRLQVYADQLSRDLCYAGEWGKEPTTMSKWGRDTLTIYYDVKRELTARGF